jgi:signal transduction histidine kinase
MLVDGEAEDTETIEQFCGIIQGQAQRLSRLIEDILNISRIESGLVKVSKETHSLALVIRDSVKMITSDSGFRQNDHELCSGKEHHGSFPGLDPV